MSDWYSSGSWYAPLHEEAEPEKGKQKKKKKAWPRIAGACFVMIALIVATSLAFSNKDEPQLTQDFDLPDIDEMPENYEDFFSSYFQTVTADTAAIDVERTKYSESFSVELQAAAGEALGLSELYERCAPSVVAICGYKDGKLGFNWGSGFIVSEDGLIVTNTHIIEGCSRATVTLSDDTVFEAKLVGADSISDVALLKIETSGLSPAEFGDSEALTVGENVAAIGNPLGEEFRFTLTNGIVSAIQRDVNYNGHVTSRIQTNTAINEGNSGGPLFNMYGQVVGITNMKMMSMYSSIEGIGFAIPSATVRSVVSEFILHGEVRGRPSLGVTVGAIPKEAADEYDLPQGLYVSGVQDNSDAKAKGIMTGDIILAVNGETVTKTDDVARIKNALSVGDSMTLTVWRDGQTLDITIVLMDTNDIY